MQKTLILIAGILLGLSLTPAKERMFGAIETEGLTDQQLYILTEILQDRLPTINVKYPNPKSFAKDYIEVAKALKADFKEAVEVCKRNKGDDACNLYLKIKERIDIIN